MIVYIIGLLLLENSTLLDMKPKGYPSWIYWFIMSYCSLFPLAVVFIIAGRLSIILSNSVIIIII